MTPVEKLQQEKRIVCSRLPSSIHEARELIAEGLLIIKDDYAREELKQALQHGPA